MELGTAAISKTFYKLRRLSRKLWIRAALIAGLGVVAALLGRPLSPMVPEWMAEKFSASDVTRLLEIIASSMLAVTIFSLSVMVSARQSASSQVTPRSHQVLIEDTTTQTVLATFLGAFVFSLVGLIVLGTGVYSGQSPTIVLGFTLLVVTLVVIAILRWIDHLSDLGSVVETTRRIEALAQQALKARAEWPCLGAHALIGSDIPQGAAMLPAWRTAHVRHIDFAALQDACEETGATIYIVAPPGRLVSEGETLLHHVGPIDKDTVGRAFTLSDTRMFDQDPRFGMLVLSEIAQRALSPGINDPGTAIDIISRLHRLLLGFRDETEPRSEVYFPRLWLVPVTADELMRDAVDPIARDGAGNVEVHVRLQKMLVALARSPDAKLSEAARATSARALAMSLPEQLLDEHRERLKALAASAEVSPHSAASR